MNKLSFVLIIFTLITIQSVIGGQRSIDAWPKEFDVTKLKNYEKMRKFFAVVPKNDAEDHIRVHIQRRWTGIKFSNGTIWKNETVKYAPTTVYVVEPKRSIRYLAAAYTILTVLSTLVCTVYTFFAMLKSASPVWVKDLHDINKPAREMPTHVSLQLFGKKWGPTPIITKAPKEEAGEDGESTVEVAKKSKTLKLKAAGISK